MSTQYNETNPILESNIARTEFGISWFNMINGKSVIRPYPTASDINCLSFIEKEKIANGKVSFGVIPFKRVSERRNITKDTFVSNSIPALSFGEYSFIKIGNDKNNRYKSFVNFDVSELKDKIITKAYLVLYSQDNKSTKISIGEVLKKWEENSITWNYHPLSKKIKDVNISNISSRVTIDLTDFFRNYDYNKEFHGLSLYNDEAELNDYKSFVSKEYIYNQYRPYFEIEYLDPTSYYDYKEIVRAYAEIHSSTMKNDTVKAKSYIDREDMYSKIRCRARIKPEMIEAKANIQKINDKIKAKSKIVYEDISLKGKFVIAEFLFNDSFKGKFTIPQDKIRCKSIIQIKNDLLRAKSSIEQNTEIKCTAKIISSSDKMRAKSKIEFQDLSLKGTSYITELLVNNLNCIANIPTDKIKCKSYILATSGINCHGYITELYNSNIICKSVISREYITAVSSIMSMNNELEVKAQIISQNSLLNCKASIISEKNIKAKANIIIIDINDDMKARGVIAQTSKIDGKVSILTTNDTLTGINRIVVANDTLKAKSNILYQNIELKAKANVIVNDDTLKAKSDIGYQNIDLKAKSDIVYQNIDLKAKSDIIVIAINDDMKAIGVIAQINKIDGKVSILTTNDTLTGINRIVVANDTLKAKSNILYQNIELKAKANIIVNDDTLKAKSIIGYKNIDLKAKSLVVYQNIDLKAKSDIIVIAINDDMKAIGVITDIEEYFDQYVFIM